jgi:hypothetical protein
MMKQEKNMTRDIRMSEEQIRALINLLGPVDQITVDPDFAVELRDMLEDTLQSDPDVLHDFTA